jgi:NAD+ synthase
MRSLNLETETNLIVSFIRQTVHNAGFSQIVLGLSGGVDSAVAATLAVKALGKENVHVVLLPYGKLNEIAQKNAQTLIKQLQIPENNIHAIDITSIVNQFENHLSLISYRLLPADLVRLGNIAARVRMIILFDLAKKLSALVMGTENKSEQILGYFTRFGDAASDIEPIQHLYKTEIFKLAKHLQIPDSIINQAPSANLWEAQTDEGEFGFTYQQADEIIYQSFELKKTDKELIKQGIDQKTINKVKSWIAKMSFKHKTPYKF